MFGLPGANPFRLTPSYEGRGVACDARGCYVGGIPLLARKRDESDRDTWVPRPLPELNQALSTRYGQAVDLAPKFPGLSAVADALNRGDVFRAQTGTLSLRLPDPPTPAAGNGSAMRLASMLQSSGMLRDGLPPSGAASNDDGGGLPAPQPRAESRGVPRYGSDPRVMPAQEFFFSQIPMEIPWARPQFPTPPLLPWDFVRPGPGSIPWDLPTGIRPRPWYGPRPDIPLLPPTARPARPEDDVRPVPWDVPWARKPWFELEGPDDAYDSEDCKEQRAHAHEYCGELARRHKLAANGYRSRQHCWDSRVAEECGGTPTSEGYRRLSA